MYDVLIVTEDLGLNQRLESAYSDDRDIRFFITDSGEKASQLIEEREFCVAFLSLNIPVLNGDEIAELILDKTYDAQLIFLYDNENIREAIDLFNEIDNVKLLYKNVDPDMLHSEITAAIDRYTYEERIAKRNTEYRAREKSYMDSMEKMSALLNSRSECYNHMICFFLASCSMYFEDPHNSILASAIEFMFKELDDYVKIYLTEMNYETRLLKDIEEKCMSPQDFKFFKMILPTNMPRREMLCDIVFMLRIITDSFYAYMQSYRGKAELKETESGYVLDITYDLRAGNYDALKWGYICVIIENIIKAFCFKSAVGTKDGYMQYRLFYADVDDNREQANR